MKAKCGIISEKLAGYASGGLSMEETMEISRHIGECAFCKEEYQILTGITSAIRECSVSFDENTKKEIFKILEDKLEHTPPQKESIFSIIMLKDLVRNSFLKPVFAAAAIVVILSGFFVNPLWIKEQVYYLFLTEKDGGTVDIKNNMLSMTSSAYAGEKCDYYWIEAENCVLGSTMKEYKDGSASGKKYITTFKAGEYKPGRYLTSRGHYSSGKFLTCSGIALFTLDIKAEGKYVIWMRVLTKGSSCDSIFLRVNRNYEDTVHFIRFKDWKWDRIRFQGNGDFEESEFDPMFFELKKGNNIFVIMGREQLTKIDKILVTNDMDFKPEDTGKQQEEY